MTHTAVYDIHEQNKTIANAVNSAFRHCRIGKVRRKFVVQTPKIPVTPIVFGPYDPQWWEYPPIGAGRNLRKCSCKPGQPCGNAACPHMPGVTC